MGDADITLRHLTRRRPEELVRGLLPNDLPCQILGWVDSQLTALERRLDKALDLLVNGYPSLMHLEFQLDLENDLPYRIFEYQCLLTMAKRAEAKGAEPPPIESVVVLLRGRKRRWPEQIEYRRSWPGRPFHGVRFRIEPVYQRTVNQLRNKGGLFWLVFTPLARDATADNLLAVIGEIRRAEPDPRERAELFTAMLVLANFNSWGHNLRKEIEAMLEEGEQKFIMASDLLRDAFLRGEKQGIEQGIEQGKEEGIGQGIDHLLRRLFTRRLGRTLTPQEQELVAKRASDMGLDHVEEAVLTLHGEALAQWLRHDAQESQKDPG
jgi:hypothetical protein